MLFTQQTRKHSSRMRTVRLPTVHTTQATRCQHRWGSSSEQVWLRHCPWPPNVTSMGFLRGGGGLRLCGEACYCHIGSFRLPWTDRLTRHTRQNITFPQIRCRVVTSILFTTVKAIRNSNSFTSILHTPDIGLAFRERGFNSFQLSR